MFIYKITNTINGKLYVGQTTLSISKRFASHVKSYNSKAKRNSFLYNAIRKHGISNFLIEELDTATNIDDLNNKEIYWIQELKSIAPFGYNLRLGGSNGGKFSQELKNKISVAIKLAYAKKGKFIKKPHSQETKLKISMANMGKKVLKFSDEHKRKISESQKGISKPKSKKWCENQKLKMTGRKNSDETKKKRAISKQKSVTCITNNLIFDSLKSVSIYLGIKGSGSVCSHLKNKNSYITNKNTGEKLMFRYTGDTNV